MATSVEAQLRGSAILLHLSLGRHGKDLADTALGMIGDFEVAWLTEDQYPAWSFISVVPEVMQVQMTTEEATFDQPRQPNAFEIS